MYINQLKIITMGTLRFSDGINIDTSGEIRRLKLKDGLYVVGNGMLIPCKDEKEVKELINKFKPKKQMQRSPSDDAFWSDCMMTIKKLQK